MVATSACLNAQALTGCLLVAVLEAGSVELLELLNQSVELVGILRPMKTQCQTRRMSGARRNLYADEPRSVAC